MRVLFLVPYPIEGASNRVRVEQFIPYLESKGVVCKVRPFVNPRFFRILYLPHCYAEKAFWCALSTLNRALDIMRACFYDVVFIHREAYPFGGPLVESLLHAIGKPMVFDFDDAIFLPNTSEENIYIERLKRPDKVYRIIRMSRAVIAGNAYLEEYAARYNDNVVVIASSVDTGTYVPAARPERDEVVVGWIGSNTTKNFLCDLKGVFGELSRRHRNVRFKFVGAKVYGMGLPQTVNKEWTLEDELKDLQGFDIGIMPMPDNEWTKGKCGFKALLYMSCGIPVVASPVGINTEIVDDGVNGFFARNGAEWLDRLSRLIEDRRLRFEMGKKGREKVVQKFSLESASPLLYGTLERVFLGIGKHEE